MGFSTLWGFLANEGRYEFMATREAPKLKFARTGSSADVTHFEDPDRSMRKRIVEMDPKAAKENSSFFLDSAIRVKPECNSSTVNICIRKNPKY